MPRFRKVRNGPRSRRVWSIDSFAAVAAISALGPCATRMWPLALRSFRPTKYGRFPLLLHRLSLQPSQVRMLIRIVKVLDILVENVEEYDF